MLEQSFIPSVNCRGRLLDLSTCAIMAIVNLTNDSFYSGSRVRSREKIMEAVGTHMDQGAKIIDLGAMSTRPGAAEIDQNEEEQIICEHLEELLQRFPQALFSIDTYRANVAQSALTIGAHMINDVSGLTFDNGMIDLLQSYSDVPYILMHNRAKSAEMQKFANYDDVVDEVKRFYIDKINKLFSSNIKDIILDPGFGFSKGIKHNFELLNRLEEFSIFDKPILVGISRKSFIYKTLEGSADNALNGTTALHMMALSKGTNILRVHDTKEAVECVKLYNELKNVN